MKQNSSKILRDISNALGIYAQSIFIAPAITPSLLSSIISAASAAASGNILSATVSGSASLSNNPSNAQTSSGQPASAGIAQSAQASFYYKGQWLPIACVHTPRHAKSVYLVQLEKVDAPPILDGYGLTIVYYTMLELCVSILQIIDNDLQKAGGHNLMPKGDSSQVNAQQLDCLPQDTRQLHRELLNSTWTGAYAVLSLLLDASTDEVLTEQILGLLEQLTAAYGSYGLNIAQRAMVTLLCKASLPIGYPLPQLVFRIPALSSSVGDVRNTSNAHSRASSGDSNSSSSSLSTLTQLSNNAYTLQQTANVLTSAHAAYSGLTNSSNNSSTSTPITSGSSSTNHTGAIGNLHNGSTTGLSMMSYGDAYDFRQQVVAVGTALPHNASALHSSGQPSSITSGQSNQQPSSVMLTAKNLQCMKQLLKIAHEQGLLLRDNWYSVLLTLQHLVWILGLKPAAGGSLKSSKSLTDQAQNTSIVTTAAMADLPMLSTMLTRLFDSSQ